MDEFGLIARFFAPLAVAEPGALGLTDDGAVLDFPAGASVVAVTDAVVAGVHFLPDDAPGDIARKAMRVNLSDLAAMGATPRAVLLAAVLPRDTDETWLGAFADGLGADCAAFGAPLVGGDTAASDGPLTLVITALGAVPRGCALTRSGARAGDDIYVSGTLGDAALGLAILDHEITAPDGAAALIARYRVPEPRLGLGAALVGLASACIDVSDGLVADLGHVCECSRLGAVIRADAVPLSEAGRAVVEKQPGLLARVVTGGDDYELVFTAPVSARAQIAETAKAAAVAVTRIGAMKPGTGVEVEDATALGLELGTPGFKHFGG